MSNRKRRRDLRAWAAKTMVDVDLARSGADAPEGTPERAAWDTSVASTTRRMLSQGAPGDRIET